MGCVPHLAFWCAAIASSLMSIALVIPLWLGRVAVSGATMLWGLWYRLDCDNDKCATYGQIMDSNSVPRVTDAWDFDIIVVPVLVVICVIICFLGVLILELLSCRCCGPDFNPRKIIVICAIMFLISAIIGTIGLFIDWYVLDKFYKENEINHAAEFPWAVMIFTIGVILLFVAAVLFMYITCNWHTYSEYYGYAPWFYDTFHGSRGSSSGDRYSSRDSFRQRPYSSSYVKRSRSSGDLTSSYRQQNIGVSSFANTGYGKSDYGKSDYGKSSTGSFDFRLSKAKKSNSSSDLRSSRRSLHDMPAILSHTLTEEYVRDERDSQRASRYTRRSESPTIDHRQISTGVTGYRESRVNQLIDESRGSSRTGSDSGPYVVSTREEPNVLDILYRESRRE